MGRKDSDIMYGIPGSDVYLNIPRNKQLPVKSISEGSYTRFNCHGVVSHQYTHLYVSMCQANCPQQHTLPVLSRSVTNFLVSLENKSQISRGRHSGHRFESLYHRRNRYRDLRRGRHMVYTALLATKMRFVYW